MLQDLETLANHLEQTLTEIEVASNQLRLERPRDVLDAPRRAPPREARAP